MADEAEQRLRLDFLLQEGLLCSARLSIADIPTLYAHDSDAAA